MKGRGISTNGYAARRQAEEHRAEHFCESKDTKSPSKTMKLSLNFPYGKAPAERHRQDIHHLFSIVIIVFTILVPQIQCLYLPPASNALHTDLCCWHILRLRDHDLHGTFDLDERLVHLVQDLLLVHQRELSVLHDDDAVDNAGVHDVALEDEASVKSGPVSRATWIVTHVRGEYDMAHDLIHTLDIQRRESVMIQVQQQEIRLVTRSDDSSLDSEGFRTIHTSHLEDFSGHQETGVLVDGSVDEGAELHDLNHGVGVVAFG